MDMKLYKQIVDILADNKITKSVKVQKIQDIYKSRNINITIRKIDNLFDDFNKFPYKSEIIGNNSIKDAIRIFKLENIGNEIYGYCGKANRWKDLEGGANQMNTVFSLKTMIELSIVTDVKENVPVRSK